MTLHRSLVAIAVVALASLTISSDAFAQSGSRGGFVPSAPIRSAPIVSSPRISSPVISSGSTSRSFSSPVVSSGSTSRSFSSPVVSSGSTSRSFSSPVVSSGSTSRSFSSPVVSRSVAQPVYSQPIYSQPVYSSGRVISQSSFRQPIVTSSSRSFVQPVRRSYYPTYRSSYGYGCGN